LFGTFGLAKAVEYVGLSILAGFHAAILAMTPWSDEGQISAATPPGQA
jgi:hypothetical protein